MATFDEHIAHAKSNLDYLSKTNNLLNDKWDWQVTTCFYSALHLMNAHIAAKAQKNYLSHGQVDNALNPYGYSPAKVDEDTYTSYNSLQNLSRRSRYLLHENRDSTKNVDIQQLCLTRSIHFKRSIHHLDAIITFMKKEYNATFPKESVKCIDLNGLTFPNFNIVQ